MVCMGLSKHNHNLVSTQKESETVLWPTDVQVFSGQILSNLCQFSTENTSAGHIQVDSNSRQYNQCYMITIYQQCDNVKVGTHSDELPQNYYIESVAPTHLDRGLQGVSAHYLAA